MTTQVLVVDDVPALAEQYAYDLKRVGKYDAIVAAGGAEALLQDVIARVWDLNDRIGRDFLGHFVPA